MTPYEYSRCYIHASFTHVCASILSIYFFFLLLFYDFVVCEKKKGQAASPQERNKQQQQQKRAFDNQVGTAPLT